MIKKTYVMLNEYNEEAIRDFAHEHKDDNVIQLGDNTEALTFLDIMDIATDLVRPVTVTRDTSRYQLAIAQLKRIRVHVYNG